MKTLRLNLKGVYFDQIKSGKKTEEYRRTSDYWRQRLGACDFDTITLLRGYPKGDGIEGETRLTRKWRGFKIRDLVHEHFGNVSIPVYAIDVSEPYQGKN